MTDTSVRLELPFIQAAQAQKHVTHNEALLRLDLLVQLVVEDFGAQVPPSSPDAGQIWALGDAPTGDWSGRPGTLAAYIDEGWVFVPLQEGWQAYGRADGSFRQWLGTAWSDAQSDFNNLPGVGINATSDTTNRLAVSSAATLLTHDGAGHQLKLNKASLEDTASLLYQNGFSGRAEMGLAGNDAFSVKVSVDGSTWHTALLADPATGAATFPNGAEIGGTLTGTAITQTAADATAGRILKVGDSATLLSASPALRMAVGGSADVLNITTGAEISGTPPEGLQVRFRASASNTGPATIALDGGSAIDCRTISGTALPADYIRTDADTCAQFDGTHWILSREMQRTTFATGTVVQWADGTIQCQMICNVDVTTTDVQTFDLPVGFVSIGESATGTVSMSHFTGSPNSALRYSNIRGMRVTTSGVQIRLIVAGTSSDPGGDSERVFVTAIGNWY